MASLPSCAQSPNAWYCYGQGEQFGDQYMGSVEHGVDISTPFHTPITALYGGRITDASYQPWGGQVGILTDVPGYGTVVEYVQHLDQIARNIVPGAQVTSGELLGLSGGQLSGGSHPTTLQYSSGPHTEFGFDAPWIAGVTRSMPTSFPPNFAINAAGGGGLPSGAGPNCGPEPANCLPPFAGRPDCQAWVNCKVSQIPVIGGLQNGLNLSLPNVEQFAANLTNQSLWIGKILPVALGFIIVVVALYALFK